MNAVFFPDATVLINIQAINRWDVLAELVKGGAKWVASVQDECRKWDKQDRDSATAIFGPAIRPDPAEHINIRILRNEMADPAEDHPLKHLGEAETIVIANARFPGARFITDDRGAYAAAKAQGIQCFGTGDLLVVAERTGLITASERISDLATLRAANHFPQSYYNS